MGVVTSGRGQAFTCSSAVRLKQTGPGGQRRTPGTEPTPPRPAVPAAGGLWRLFLTESVWVPVDGGRDPLPVRGRVSVDVTCREEGSGTMRDLHLNNKTCLNGKTTCPLSPGVLGTRTGSGSRSRFCCRTNTKDPLRVDLGDCF